MSHLHRLVTRITLIGAAASAAILAIVGLVANNPNLLWEATGPGLISVLILPMVLRGREHAAVAFSLAMTSVVVTFKLVGSPTNTVAATTAVVILASLTVLFLNRYVLHYLAVGLVAMALIPIFWANRIESTLATGLVMALTFLVSAVAFLLVRNAAAEVNNRYRLTFDAAPVALVEIDWSEVLSHLDALHVVDVETAVENDSAFLADLIERARIIRANAEAAAIFGVADPSVLLGTPDRQYAEGALAGWWRTQLASIRVGGPIIDQEISLADFGVERWINVRTIRSSVKGAGSTTSIMALADVTSSRLYQKSLTELIDAKDEFIATVSHELRTPLTAVVGLTSALASSEALDRDEEAELLRLVITQASEISFIVEDLLVAARADIGTVSVVCEPTDLMRATEDVIAAMSCGIQISLAEERPIVDGDPVRIAQILRNLIVNADRYGGRERRIVLSTEGGDACLEVRDSGEAIAAEARQRIFERYERAHDRSGRTMAMGLGLSVSRRLARMMSGDLVYTHDGESVFRLTLPLVTSADEASSLVAEPAASR